MSSQARQRAKVTSLEIIRRGAGLVFLALLATSCELSGTNTNAGSSTGLSASDASLLYVSKQGDTMTGPLNLPTNGLVAGTNQFALSGGDVGIGTASPGELLEILSTDTVTYNARWGAAMEQLNMNVSNGAPGISFVGNGNQEWRVGIWGSDQSEFMLLDNTNGHTPFRVFPGAGDDTMVLSGTGRVGIGNPAPSDVLSVSPVQYRTGTASQLLTTITGSGTAWTSAMVGSQFVFQGADSDQPLNAGTITAVTSGTQLTVTSSQTVGSSGYSINYTGLNVDSSGNVGIGTTTPAQTLDIENTGGGAVAQFGDGSASCTLTPTAGSASFFCSSDERLKKDIRPVANADSLEKILKLKTVTFAWKKGDSGRHTGYIAQQIEKVAPEFVSNGKNGYKQVAYGGFIPWITGAIQEIYTQLTNYTQSNDARVADLKKDVDDLKTRIARAPASANAVPVEMASLKAQNQALEAQLENAIREETKIRAWACSQSPQPHFCK